MIKKYPLVFIAAILMIAAAAIVLFDRKGSQRDLLEGSSPLAIDLLYEVRGISIEKGGAKLTLTADDKNVWSLQSNNLQLPANAEKIARELGRLGKATFLQMVADNPERFEPFGLKSATMVTFRAADKVLLTLGLGDKRSGGGQYVSLADKNEAYLLSESIDFSADENEWELKELFRLKKDEVKSIEIQGDGKSLKTPITVSREKADATWIAANAKPNEKVNVSEMDALLGQLVIVRYNKRVDSGNEQAKTALSKPHKLLVRLLDGREYKLSAGSVGEDNNKKYFLRAVATAGSSTGATADGVNTLNRLMSQWAFEVPQSIYDKFKLTAKDLIEKDVVANSKEKSGGS